MGAALRTIGTIEGFYGPPWTHEQRLDHLRFAAGAGFDTVVYAPKDDPYHRRRWRDPYPPDELSRLAALAAAAAEGGLRFVYALHPALDMRYSDETEHAALAAKAEQVFAVGVRSFALLFDDVPYVLAVADEAVFGAAGAGLGAAHGVTVRRFRDAFLLPRGLDDAVLVCPTDYAGVAASPYREAFAAAAPAEVVVTWTGRGVVVASVTRAEIDAAAESYRRPLVLWDNFPVNDYEPSRLFLGPLTGRTGDLEGSALVGVVANAMLVEEASRIPLATVAAWAADPASYDASAAHAAALSSLGAARLEPFVRVCSAWPPSADQDPSLSSAVAGALAGESGALGVLSDRLSALLACVTDAEAPSSLVRALEPWLAGATATARAGLAAVGLLRGDVPADAVRAALAEADAHYCNVLRPMVPAFVRAALEQVAPVAPVGPTVAVLGEASDPAVVATCEVLRSLGCAPVVGGDVGSSSFVVVTKSAGDVTALAGAPVPVIAWGRLADLDMATATDGVMLWEGVTICSPDDPLAAGLAGRVPLYRGPSFVSVATVAPSATVVVRGPDAADRPVVFRYDAGAALASGAVAPALRIGSFPALPGPAAWLLDDTGHALFAAAVRMVLGDDLGALRSS